MAGTGRAREGQNRLTRLLAIAALGALFCLLPGLGAGAADPEAPAGSQQLERQASRLTSAADSVVAAAAEAGRLGSQSAPAQAIDRVRHDLEVAQVQYRMRQAVRHEQVLIYELAKRPDQLPQLTSLLTPPVGTGLRASSAALEAAWRLSAVDDLTQIHPRYTHLYTAAEPVTNLAGYYRDAAARAGIDWSYLAAVNFIESDFGRVDGPSNAGALGPMQFIASTWSEYGAGGDIMSPHDSIEAAATLLARNGAPADYDRAVFRYNHDSDYVAAVKGYAAAMRSDPLWLTRLYYWSTYG